MKLSFRLTREGKRFLFAVVVIAFAAFNTGNNLIYLILSLMTALLCLSILIPVLSLRGVSCYPGISGPIHAGKPVTVAAETENLKRLSSYSVSLILHPALPSLYFPVIKKGTGRVTFENLIFPRRGKYLIERIILSTGFPSIFITALKSIEFHQELVIYPAIEDVSKFIHRIRTEPVPGKTRTEEGDFLHLREYVPGDESRKVDWKATARTGTTMVREFSQKQSSSISVFLDTSGQPGSVTFEKAVSIAASLCAELISRGFRLRLVTCGTTLPYGRGTAYLERILDFLAGVGREGAVLFPDADQTGTRILVLGSDDPGFTPDGRYSMIIDARSLIKDAATASAPEDGR